MAFFGIYMRQGDLNKTIVKGGNDVRWGIDIRGGVDVTFTPPEGVDATDEQMEAARSVIDVRLVNQNIADYELYVDTTKDRIIVRFPWKEGETDFDPQKAIQELGETALLTFRELAEVDAEGKPTGTTAEKIVLQGSDVVQASPQILQDSGQYVVQLEITQDAADRFAEATERLVGKPISIWMDDTLISAPTVNARIDSTTCYIEGGFTAETARDLANKINSGALPFKLETQNYNTISPILGLQAKDVMVQAGIVGFILVSIYMIALYRLPGVIAVIALMGQMAGAVAAVTGFFPFVPSFTLTLPGIAGIILSIGMGVDANIITAERIKEEIRAGRSVEGAIDSGNERSFAAIFDGNITVIIVAIILMGAFGPPSSLFATLLSPFFSFFGPSTAGTIYSFGYTLLVGTICNFVFGVSASRLMLKSIARFKAFKKPRLYGGAK